MPVYSEVLNDSEIISLIADNVRNVLVIGCGGCMNESLAAKHNLPIVDYPSGSTELTPIPVTQELERIAQMLRERGCTVHTKVNKEGSPWGCMTNSGQASWRQVYCGDDVPEIVLALCCPAGRYGIQEIAGAIPVICATRQLGLLRYSYHVSANGKREMESESVRIIAFQSSDNCLKEIGNGY